MAKHLSPTEALNYVKSNDCIYIHSVAASPQILIDALAKRACELKNVEIVHLHTECKPSYINENYPDSFKLKSFFVGANVRRATQSGIADYIPVFLSEIPALFTKNILPLDVALVQVSPPDQHGYCSLGVSVDATYSAVKCAKLVIAQVNENMPRTYGDGLMHLKHFDILVEHNSDLPCIVMPEPTDIEMRIGKHTSGLIEDGATLQMGIGAIPNAGITRWTQRPWHSYRDVFRWFNSSG